jgi:hypothetical protein
MAQYIPKVNDPVFVPGKLPKGRWVVIAVDAKKQTVSVQSVSGGAVTFQHHNIQWFRLVPLDASQNALQVVREATEGK